MIKQEKREYQKIAYLGIPGSFAFSAAKKFFGKGIKLISSQSISEVFEKVKRRNCSFGVVPLENSTTGSIIQTYDNLISSKLSIVSEVILKIHHHLLTGPGAAIKKIKLCYSHPQAISQCDSFFKIHPWIKPVFVSNTASAAKLVSENKKSTEAAIAGSDAGKIYKLAMQAKNIEDNKRNFTRFVIISRNKKKIGDKISLVFSIKHIPGSLFKVLKPYAKYGLNLTKIESRPVFGKPWEYIFFLDFEIGEKEKEVKKVIKEMKKVTQWISLLGKYKKGKIYET